MADLPEHVARNRAYWDERAPDYVEEGRRNWESEEPTWGIFGVPESEVGMLPRELEGRDAIELGCGTGYVSAWLARRGARPVGIDNSRSAAGHRARLPAGVRPRVPARSTATPRRSPTPTNPSTSRSPSTARASGATPTAGSPRRPASCVPAASWSSSSTRSSRSSAAPTTATTRPATSSSARSSACTGSNGPTTTRSNSTSRRQDDRPPPRLRPHGRGADRSPPARRRDHPLPHLPRLGAPLSLRGSLARPQTRLSRYGAARISFLLTNSSAP